MKNDFKQWSESAEKKLNELKKKYPDQRSAVMPALYMAQEFFGSITEDAVQWISKQLDLPPVSVMEVATFYTMYYKKPVGRYHFQVCRTLSCALRGSKKVTEQLAKRFGVSANQVSSNGMWSYEEVECLGSCGTAPMCEINDRYFENLTPEKIDKIIDMIEASKPDLRFSAVTDKLGDGLSEFPKSEVI